PAADAQSAFGIELAAYDGGVPMARPISTMDGHSWVEIDGALFRCHGWIDGTAKENQDTSSSEAAAMGRIVAQTGQSTRGTPSKASSPTTRRRCGWPRQENTS